MGVQQQASEGERGIFIGVVSCYYRLVIVVLISQSKVRSLDDVDVLEDLVQQILTSCFPLKCFRFRKNILKINIPRCDLEFDKIRWNVF